MNVGRLATVATAMVALASWSAQAQVFEANVTNGKLFSTEEGEEPRIERNRFNEADIVDFLGAPEDSRLVMEYDAGGDECVYVVDGDGEFWDFFMESVDAGCAEDERESATRFKRKEFCVELISLFGSEGIDGAATCRITSTFTEEDQKLSKRCHIEAIDPESGWPVEFTLSGGKQTELEPFCGLD